MDRNGYVEKIMADYDTLMKEIELLPPKKRQIKELEVTKKLGTFYCEDTDFTYYLVTTPLHLAAKQGYLQIVELLISVEEHRPGVLPTIEGLDTEITKAINLSEIGSRGDGNDLIHSITVPQPNLNKSLDSQGNSEDPAQDPLATDTANLLLKHMTGESLSAKINACDYDNHQLYKIKKILNARNEQRQTALHLAAFGGHVSVVRAIANTGLADPSVQDIRQETPLHLSAEGGSAETTEILLQAGAIPFLADLKGKTAVEVAARGNFVTLVDMIIKAERVHKKLNETNQDVRIIQNIYFGSDTNTGTEHLRNILFKLSTKKFRKGDWNILAKYWNYSEIQIRCVEEQFIHKKGFKEHGHRFLLIWLFECLICQRNPIKELYEGLVAIRRKDFAEQIRLMANSQPNDSHCVLT